MSGLIYYIRGAENVPTEQQMLTCSLIGERVKSWFNCRHFIDGSQGTTFSLHGKSRGDFRINFENEVQVWHDIPGTPLSIGYNIDQPPQPSDFLKHDFLPGHRLILGDNQEYIVPLARKFNAGCVLPFDLSMLVEGELKKVTVSKYLELQKIAEKLAVWQGFVKGAEKDTEFLSTDAKYFMTCCKVMAINYHLDHREISILKLFNSINAIKILQYVVDSPYLDEVEAENLIEDESKKKS